MNNLRPNNRNRKIPIQRTILILNLICRHPKVKSPRLLGCLASSSPPEKHHPPWCKPDLPLQGVSSPHRWLCPKLSLVLRSPHCCRHELKVFFFLMERQASQPAALDSCLNCVLFLFVRWFYRILIDYLKKFENKQSNSNNEGNTVTTIYTDQIKEIQIAYII